MIKIKRITVDLDDKKLLSIIRCWSILEVYGFGDIEFKPSPSNRGFHVTAWHKEGYDIDKLLRIRFIAGDDKARIFLDSFTNRTINILFDTKEVYIFKNDKELKKFVGKK